MAAIPNEMTRTERVMAAVAGDEVDRVPVCFWHHFRPHGSGLKMAEATYRFFQTSFDLDIVKIMPDLPYPFPRKSIRASADWRTVEHINVERSRFFRQRAVSIQSLRDTVGYDTPIVMTVFSPLCEMLHIADSKERFLRHLEEDPAAVHEALATIAENLRAHLQDCIDAGADGIFFALQGCTSSIMTPEQYREVGRPYDLLALQGCRDAWLNILHIHGDNDLFFDDVVDYPVQVLSWSDRLAGPSLRDARARTSKCLMGGWHEFGALSNGPVEAIREEALDALRQTSGRKFILANGCSVPDDTDERWLHAARQIVDELRYADWAGYSAPVASTIAAADDSDGDEVMDVVDDGDGDDIDAIAAQVDVTDDINADEAGADLESGTADEGDAPIAARPVIGDEDALAGTTTEWEIEEAVVRKDDDAQ